MSKEVTLRSREDIFKFVFKLTQWGMQYPRFVDERGKQLVIELMLPEIKKRMKDFNYSSKIIDATIVTDVEVHQEGFMEIAIDSDYTADNNFNVGTAREKGTKDHFIAPVIAQALSFILQGATGLISAFRVFSKGHWVKGITASNVIEKTIEELTPKVQEALNAETDQSLIEKVER